MLLLLLLLLRPPLADDEPAPMISVNVGRAARPCCPVGRKAKLDDQGYIPVRARRCSAGAVLSEVAHFPFLYVPVHTTLLAVLSPLTAEIE